MEKFFLDTVFPRDELDVVNNQNIAISPIEFFEIVHLICLHAFNTEEEVNGLLASLKKNAVTVSSGSFVFFALYLLCDLCGFCIFNSI